MSTQLTVKDEFASSLTQLEQVTKACSLLANTPHYKKLGADGCFAIATFAQAINLNIVQALNGSLIYIKGKVGMSAEFMLERIRAAGHSVTRVEEKCSETVVTLRGKRCDNGDVIETSFSLDEAKKAGLWSPGNTWDKYTKDLCHARAVSRMYRQLTPDLSRNGGYTADELMEIAKSKGKPSEDEKILTIDLEDSRETSSNKEIFVSKMRSLIGLDKEFEASLNERMKNHDIISWEDMPESWYSRALDLASKHKQQKAAM